MQRELTDKNLEYEIIEWICQNDKDFNEAKLHGYDLRMEESEIIYWMKKYADYKSRLAENLVRQGEVQPMQTAGQYTDPKTLPKDIKVKLLIIRDELTAGDYSEAWHHLYSIASPNFDKTEPWKDLEDE